MTVSVFASAPTAEAIGAAAPARVAGSVPPWTSPPDWILQRNCSLSPAALARVLMALGAVSAAVSVFFWMHGAWLVLPFAVLEVGALAMAFFWYARHAIDGDRLWLRDNRLWVESRRGGVVEQRSVDGTWLRVDPPGTPREGIALRGGAAVLEVGRHATAARRAQVAREIRQALDTVRRRPGMDE